MSQKVLNKRSSALSNGEAKLPTPSQLDYGEIAVNFADGHETLSIKNNSNEIATFSSDEYNSVNYATKTEVGNASGNAVTSARNYTNAISGQLATYIDTNVVGVYRYKGSVTNYSDLSSVSDKEHGDVYNVVNANGNIPAGTNYAWNSGTTSWDSLGGSIDLSAYALTADLTAHTTDTTVHVSSSEKSTWNGKQDAISDLETIRTGAGLGATAIQTETQLTSATTGNGNAVTRIEVNGHEITYVRGTKFATNADFTAHTASTNIHLTSGDIKTQIESYNYLTGYTETDPNVPSWAKQSTKPSYTASEVGALPTGTTLDNVADGSTRKLSNYATQANFTAHTGNTAIHLPTITSQDNGKILQVVNGAWNLVTPSTIYTGQGTPDNLLGIDGDIYLQTS